MSTNDNFLNTDSHIFSSRIHQAARCGDLNSEPFVRLLEDARQVTLGVATILQMERNNDVQRYSHDNQITGEIAEPLVDKPVCVTMMSNLLELARVSSQMIGHRIEDLADWAENSSVVKSK